MEIFADEQLLYIKTNLLRRPQEVFFLLIFSENTTSNMTRFAGGPKGSLPPCNVPRAIVEALRYQTIPKSC